MPVFCSTAAFRDMNSSGSARWWQKPPHRGKVKLLTPVAARGIRKAQTYPKLVAAAAGKQSMRIRTQPRLLTCQNWGMDTEEGC